MEMVSTRSAAEVERKLCDAEGWDICDDRPYLTEPKLPLTETHINDQMSDFDVCCRFHDIQNGINCRKVLHFCPLHDTDGLSTG